ncbi:restriction endonuclease subunit S [Dyella choica]|uniref:Restriction endonuclease subunit S n=1 Tax=Dyella choica TaxID=1927959 RepID=A0A432M5N7_9GAMM|nr:restriction endonuclease subunit S [Dyella choica]RUL75352.1 restriction endonuclease subunit S [Dyella choica]
MAAGAYPNYRQVCSRWISRVPEHWPSLRAKNFLREIDDRTKTGEETLLSMRQHRGLVPHNDVSAKRIDADNLIGYKKAQPNELVLNRMQAGNAMFFRNRQSGLVSPDYAVFRLLRDDNPEYLGHLFRSWPMRGLFRSESKGLGTGTSGFLRLYSDRFAALEIPLPARAEQDQIVAYLHAQDAHIARFIKAKRDLIDLLTEQKQTIIEAAVTQGLDASTAKRDSGINWIFQIPTHWDTCKLKHVAVFNPSRSESVALRLSDESVSFLPMECIKTDGKLRNVESRRTSEVWEGYTYFRRNDVVMAKITPCFENGKGGLLDELPTEIGFGTTEFIVLRAAVGRIRPAFLAKLLSLRTFRVLGADAMTGAAGQQRVPLDFVKNFRIALPPLDEQDQILSALQIATAEQDAVIERIWNEITLIREYRDRLIADAVTGQVDVRGWQPGPDDVVSDDDLAALGNEEADPAYEEEADGDE